MTSDEVKRTMRIDERTLAILDRKLRRILDLGQGEESLRELPDFLRWMLGDPFLSACVREIVRMHDREDSEIDRLVVEALPRVAAIGAEFREAVPNSDDAMAPPLHWHKFTSAHEDALKSAGEERWGYLFTMADLLDKTANEVWKKAVREKTSDQIESLVDRVHVETRPTTYRITAHLRARRRSARAALSTIVDVIRALHPPVDGIKHWTDFLPRDDSKPHADRLDFDAAMHSGPAGYVQPIHQRLARFVEHVHVIAGSTLTHRTLVERFKERCTWYDKERLRALAKPGDKENPLTLELAKYLHDAGLFVLVRPRVSHLEPDAVVMRGLAVEAKAYADSTGTRQDIIHGFYQLHAYLTSLETVAAKASEGFLVTFRLGGPIYETEPTIDTGRFLLHSMTIDIGESEDSGRNQPKTIFIPTSEIFSALGVTT